MDLFLGRPDPRESEIAVEARSFYEQGRYVQAWDTWPVKCHDQRRALRLLIKHKGKKQHAYYAIDNHIKRFFVSAFQSYLFNQVVIARMPEIDRLLQGDMAYKHDNGACFRVEDPQVEQPRCDTFEISPSGPLFGYRQVLAEGSAGKIETEVLARAQLELSDFRRIEKLKIKGTRRPLRFQPRNYSISAGSDDEGDYLQLEFELDAGCYATTIIREIIKSEDFVYQAEISDNRGA